MRKILYIEVYYADSSMERIDDSEQELFLALSEEIRMTEELAERMGKGRETG